MIYTPANLTANANVTTAMASARTMVNWILVTALNGNTNDVYVGGVDPVTKKSNVSFSGTVGIRIAKGTTQLISPLSAVPFIDLSTVYFSTGTNGDGISITYAIR